MDKNMLKLTGVVIKGKQKGLKIGFPTINLNIGRKAISPGVYLGEVFWKEKIYKAAIFVNRNLLEAHLIDFFENIYGETIEIILGKKIREKMFFANDEELKEQIKKDIKLIKSK